LQAKNSCRGRGNSFGLMAPFQMTQAHNHIPDPIRKEVLRNDEKIKDEALNQKNKKVKDIIRDSNKYLSEEAAAKTKTADSYTNV
jgi:hypothetical protein